MVGEKKKKTYIVIVFRLWLGIYRESEWENFTISQGISICENLLDAILKIYASHCMKIYHKKRENSNKYLILFDVMDTEVFRRMIVMSASDLLWNEPKK